MTTANPLSRETLNAKLTEANETAVNSDLYDAGNIQLVLYANGRRDAVRASLAMLEKTRVNGAGMVRSDLYRQVDEYRRASLRRTPYEQGRYDNARALLLDLFEEWYN